MLCAQERRDILDPLHAEVDRRLPCRAEALRARLAAQVVGAGLAHVDRLARGVDGARIGERGDEAALAILGPAIVAVGLAGDGDEVGQFASRHGQALLAVVGLAGRGRKLMGGGPCAVGRAQGYAPAARL